MFRFGRWKFRCIKGNESENESINIDKLKSKVSKNIQYLRKCTDYTTKKVLEALTALHGVTISIDYQHELEKIIGAYVAEQHYGQLFPKMWTSLKGFIGKEHKDCHDNLCCMMSTYINFTDISSELSGELGKTDCISLLVGALDNCQQELLSDCDMLERTVTIVLNVIQNYSDNVRVFRKANAVPVLKKYLDHEKPTVKIKVLTILAYIADETQSSMLQTVDGAVTLLVAMLKDAVSNEDHRVNYGGGYISSALQRIQCLNKLAVNDANKVEIANHGGIPVFIRMLQDDFSEDEQIAAVKALWNLAFIEELRKSTELQESIKSLERLVISSNQELQHVCTYAMWEIKGRIPENTSLPTAQRDPPRSYEESITQPKGSAVDNPPSPTTQLMISYHWDNQRETLKIRDSLTEAGYRVWMDVTDMRGSLLEAMAEAVEKSSVILVCISEKYKKSQNCRAEAEYAFALKKKMIPLRMDEEYTPDGWLGILVRSKLYYTFYAVDQVDSNMKGLLKDIKSALRTADDDGDDDANETDGPIKQSQQGALNSSLNSPQKVCSQNKTLVSQWSREDVQTWLKDNELTELCDTFKRCKGSHLEDMYLSCCEDKKAFNDELKSDYGIDNAQTRREFVVALKDVFNEGQFD